MKKNGFTLVELLAVIAILAILVIIALPNVMGMFNEAKKNSFMTEVKEVYKVAQQTWISDSMFNTSERVYSRCDGCTDKSLELTGRTEFKYYIKFNKSGNVSEYYATDGTYQFRYDAGDLLITDITNADTVADLTDGEVLHIDGAGGYTGTDTSCRYKIVTPTGSFSTTEDVKEICVSFVNDGYQYSIKDNFIEHNGGTIRYIRISLDLSVFSNSSYLKVLNKDTNEYIYSFTYANLPQDRFDIGHGVDLKNMYYYDAVNVENADYEVLYSPDLDGHYGVSNVSSYDTIVFSGPWITDRETINKLETLGNNTNSDIVGYEKQGNKYVLKLQTRK